MGVRISTAQANISLKPNPHKIPDANPATSGGTGITGLRFLSAGSTPRAPCTGPGDPLRSVAASRHSPISASRHSPISASRHSPTLFVFGVHSDPRRHLFIFSSFNTAHISAVPPSGSGTLSRPSPAPCRFRLALFDRQVRVLAHQHFPHLRNAKSARAPSTERGKAGEVGVIWVHVAANDALRDTL